MESRNPFFKNKTFSEANSVDAEVIQNQGNVIDYGQTMTVSGTINKSFIMLLLLIATASVTWWMTYAGYNPMVFTIGGAIVAFVIVLISVFKPQYSSYLAPGYALFEGLFIGGISAIFEAMYPGFEGRH